MPSVTVLGVTSGSVYSYQDGGTYLNVRAGLNLSLSPGGITAGQQVYAFLINEGFVKFDTSVVPDGATITSVTLEMKMDNDFSNNDFTLEARIYDWGAALTTADWVPGASLSALTKVATINSAGIGSAGWKTLTSESAFVSNINKTGFTYLILVSDKTVAGTQPSDTETLSFLNTSGNLPRLTITYTDGPAAPSSIDDTGGTAYPNDYASTSHMFTMSDGNRVVVYWGGTNGGYRIYSGGLWGSFVAFTDNPTSNSRAMWTRNGNDVYGLSWVNASMRVRKLAYSGGTITQSSVAVQHAVISSGAALGIYWDSTNSYLHVKYMTQVGTEYLEAYDSSLTFKYAAAMATGIQSAFIVGDGSSTFLECWVASATLNIRRWIAGTSTYTISGDAEAGIPSLSISEVNAIYDGTNFLFVAFVGTDIKVMSRTAIDTYTSYTNICTDNPNNSPALARVGTGSDIALFYYFIGNQANGEIWYLKRVGGTWDTSPTMLAGGASTGWNKACACRDTLNDGNLVRVLYVTGTNPFTLVEDSLNFAQNFTQGVAGGVSFAGALSRRDSKGVAGGLSFAGVIKRDTFKKVLGALSFAGDTLGAKAAKKTITGVLSFSGVRTSIKVFPKITSGVLSFAGTVSRRTGKALPGALTFTGSVKRAMARGLVGILTFSGALTRRIIATKALAAVVSFVGALSRRADLFGNWLEATMRSTDGIELFRHQGNAKIIVRGPSPMAYKRGTNVLFEVTFTDKNGQNFGPDPGTAKLYCKLVSTGVYLTGYDRATGGKLLTETGDGVYEGDVQYLLTDTVGQYEVEMEGMLGTKRFLDSVKVSVRA